MSRAVAALALVLGCAQTPAPRARAVEPAASPVPSPPAAAEAPAPRPAEPRRTGADEVVARRVDGVERIRLGPNRERIIVTGYFHADSAELVDDFRDVLAEAAKIAREAKAIEAVVVEGHADELGTEEYNLALGERRADRVARYLGTLLGADPAASRSSKGNAAPVVARPSGEEERAQNRRARAQLDLRYGTSRGG